MGFELQKAIFIPREVKVSHVWPFAQMSVGDTFLVTEKMFTRCRSASRYWVNRYGMRISYRVEGKKYRFWRMA